MRWHQTTARLKPRLFVDVLLEVDLDWALWWKVGTWLERQGKVGFGDTSSGLDWRWFLDMPSYRGYTMTYKAPDPQAFSCRMMVFMLVIILFR
jgi:hypothetical protein